MLRNASELMSLLGREVLQQQVLEAQDKEWAVQNILQQFPLQMQMHLDNLININQELSKIFLLPCNVCGCGQAPGKESSEQIYNMSAHAVNTKVPESEPEVI